MSKRTLYFSRDVAHLNGSRDLVVEGADHRSRCRHRRPVPPTSVWGLAVEGGVGRESFPGRVLLRVQVGRVRVEVILHHVTPLIALLPI